MKDPNVEAPGSPDATSPWRDDLLALLKAEETERARGFNAGIHAALDLLTRHEQDRQLRSKSALKQRKVDGKKNGGDVPYGYRLADDGETLLERLDEQKVIARVRKLRKLPPKHSLREIARKLKAEKMFPRSYDPKNPDSPDEFQAVQIQRMLDEIK